MEELLFNSRYVVVVLQFAVYLFLIAKECGSGEKNYVLNLSCQF